MLPLLNVFLTKKTSRLTYRKLIRQAYIVFLGFILGSYLSSYAQTSTSPPTSLAKKNIYRWVKHPTQEQQNVDQAQQRLQTSLENPEYLLDHWIALPIAPTTRQGKTLRLSLHEAILLALRYNPNIQNAELDRIIQRYQLRLAQNEFELQYALAATGMITNSNYSGIGSASTKSYLASPEFNIKNLYGTEAALKLDHTLGLDGNYNPLLNLSVRQPLLRGFGLQANEAKLLNAVDQDALNKFNLQQAIIDQITQVTLAYRALILSGNHFQVQRQQLFEAQQEFETNEKKIEAGQLEPTANIQQSYQVESLNLMVEQAEQEFKANTQNLLQTIGLDPNLHLAVPSDVTLERIEIPNVKQSIALALEHNTQYLALKMALRADERAYEQAKNEQLWQLDLRGNILAGTVTNVDRVNQNFSGLYSGNNVSENASITLTIPLHDLNRRNALITAKVKLEQDRIALTAVKRALITTIKNSMVLIQSLIKRYDLAQRQVELAAHAYELEKKKQQAGITSTLDVNNTQNQWIQAQMGLINAKIAYLNQVSELQRLLGITLDYWKIKLRYSG